MNRLEELLVILQEEAAEVSQCASKCIRFGMNVTHKEMSNRARLEEELGDFLAIVKLISEETKLDDDHLFACVDAKLLKVEKFMKNGNINSKIPAKKSRRKTPTKKHTNLKSLIS